MLNQSQTVWPDSLLFFHNYMARHVFVKQKSFQGFQKIRSDAWFYDTKFLAEV